MRRDSGTQGIRKVSDRNSRYAPSAPQAEQEVILHKEFARISIARRAVMSMRSAASVAASLGQKTLMTKALKSAAGRRLSGSDIGLSLALATLAVSAPSAAHAAEGWYGRADVGMSIGGDADISSDVPLGGDVSLDTAVLGAAALGFAREDGWRFELELSRRENDLDAAALLDPGGSVEATAILVNLYRDFGEGRVVPYVGLGLGLAEISLEAAYTPPLNPAAVDDADMVFAYQVASGAAVRLSPTIDLDIGYRYFAAPGFEGKGAAPPFISIPVDADISQHALTVGVRFEF